MCAAAWRLWLHAGIRRRRDVGRCARAADLRRHQRDHERADREGALMLSAIAQTTGSGCLRREFIRQDEGARQAPPRRSASLPRGVRHCRRGFTLHMAQLSSLPCRFTLEPLTLTGGKEETVSRFILQDKLPPEASRPARQALSVEDLT